MQEHRGRSARKFISDLRPGRARGMVVRLCTLQTVVWSCLTMVRDEKGGLEL